MLDGYIRQYGKRLYGLCLHLCASREDAEDLYQETWLKVCKYLDRYDPAREFEPWLTRICVNTYRSIFRKLQRSPLFDRFSSGEEKDRLLLSVPDRERADYSDLYSAIRKLPGKLRITVILYYFEDLDIRTTAEVLKIPEGTVKSRLDRARNYLKGALKDE